jgi:hypothetical protein
MKFYITEETKQEIEVKIKNLEDRAYNSGVNTDHYFNCFSKIEILQEILSSATILPVEESWEKYVHPTLVPFFEKDLKNGVIIQPKQ